MSTEQEQAKRLNEALDLCIDRMSRGTTVEDCLTSNPDLSDELRPLLLTVQSLWSTARLQPRPEAKAAGRAKLEQEFEEQKTGIAYALGKASPQARARVRNALEDGRRNYESALRQIDEQLQRVSEIRSNIQHPTPNQKPPEDGEEHGDSQERSSVDDDREKPNAQDSQRPDALRPGGAGEPVTATPRPINRPGTRTGPSSRGQPVRERQTQNEGLRIIDDGPEPTEVTPTPRRRSRQPSSQAPLDHRSALEEVPRTDRPENKLPGPGQSRPRVADANSKAPLDTEAAARETNDDAEGSEDADGRNPEDEPNAQQHKRGDSSTKTLR